MPTRATRCPTTWCGSGWGNRFFSQLMGAWVRLCGARARAKAKASASGGGRRCKGISSAAWFRVLLQHAGAVHPCTARTKSPCSDVLRGLTFVASARHSFWHAGAGIDEATDLQVAKDAVVRGSGASRPWMACARLLEPWMAQPGDAPDPRTAAAPPEGDKPRCFEAALPRLPPKPVDSGAYQPGQISPPSGDRAKPGSAAVPGLRRPLIRRLAVAMVPVQALERPCPARLPLS